MERRLKANIESEIDFEKLRKQELENYEFKTLIRIPLQFFPVALISSLIFSYLLLSLIRLIPTGS